MPRALSTSSQAPFEAKTTGPEILKDFEGKRLDYWARGL